jgi:hypothetical protein
MINKLTKFFVFSLTILTVTLVAGFLKVEIDKYYKGKELYKNVLLGMLMVVLVYYPMTLFLNKFFSQVSKKMVTGSKKISKSNTLGMIIGFSIAIFVLFLGYAKLWYNYNLITDLIQKFNNL